jgi:hypothetical protein
MFIVYKIYNTRLRRKKTIGGNARQKRKPSAGLLNKKNV